MLIILYLLISEIGGLIFLAATKRNLGNFAQVIIWGFVVSPMVATALMGMPGLIVWAAHRVLGFFLYFKHFYRR